MKISQSVVELSHQLLSEAVHDGCFAIDATAGNGHDTYFLAGLVGASGKVFAFDIQEQALIKTRELLRAYGMEKRAELILQGHEHIDKYVPGKVHGVIFNLGYLPGGDKRIVTAPKTTLAALKKSTLLLAPGGIIAICVYWGHAGGPEERKRVEEWIKHLPAQEYRVMKITFPNKNKAPYLIGVQKKLWEESR